MVCHLALGPGHDAAVYLPAVDTQDTGGAVRARSPKRCDALDSIVSARTEARAPRVTPRAAAGDLKHFDSSQAQSRATRSGADGAAVDGDAPQRAPPAAVLAQRRPHNAAVYSAAAESALEPGPSGVPREAETSGGGIGNRMRPPGGAQQ